MNRMRNLMGRVAIERTLSRAAERLCRSEQELGRPLPTRDAVRMIVYEFAFAMQGTPRDAAAMSGRVMDGPESAVLIDALRKSVQRARKGDGGPRHEAVSGENADTERASVKGTV